MGVNLFHTDLMQSHLLLFPVISIGIHTIIQKRKLKAALFESGDFVSCAS